MGSYTFVLKLGYMFISNIHTAVTTTKKPTCTCIGKKSFIHREKAQWFLQRGKFFLVFQVFAELSRR